MLTFRKILFLFVNLLAFSGFSFAGIMLRTAEVTPVYARIAEEYRKVGELAADSVFFADERKYAPLGFLPVNFGNDIGFIPDERVWKSTAESAVEKTKVLQGYIITVKPTAVYAEAKRNTTEIARLEPNLRYPVRAKLTDSRQHEWYRVAIADRIGYIRANDVQPDNGVPIVMYHHILQDQENKRFRNTPTTVSSDALNFQFNLMQSLGFKIVPLKALEGYLQGSLNLPAKAAVLTFDDGLKSVYRYAYPLLKRYGFHATLFVITSRIQKVSQKWEADGLQFLSAREYGAMAENTDLHSHTHSLHHYTRFKPAATQSDDQTLYVDLIRSRQELGRLNSPPRYLAYPFGVYNEKFIAAARKAGFTLGVTTKWGKVKFGDDPMRLKRIYFTSDTPREKIADALKNE